WNPRTRRTDAAMVAAARALLLLTLPAMFSVAVAENVNPERAEAESRLTEVIAEIGRLKNSLEESRGEHRSEQARLKQLDLALQEATRKFRALEDQRRSHEAQLAELEQQREDYLDSLDQRMGQLGEQLRSAYRTGRQSRLKLVLNQDDPQQIERMLAYYDYFNQAQVERIAGLRDALETLDRMQSEIDAELSRIAAVQEEQQAILDELTRQRENRTALLADLAGRIDTEKARLEELERNRRDLEALIERLADALADIPADLGSHLGVPKQKGRLPMPVSGPVKHAFGQARGGGLRWQGWLIGADPGAEVKSVAYGRVAFADWLRGYGLLIIVDHGEDFMSLYGHNESLLHEAGDWIEPGEVISTVGSNPGNGQGLYFELRRRGKALDPAAWLKR
ncbi:MAG: peptidoglycan DD-metalloendopeptidase family protein, partial [Xanthomonadales bacterium]|nr:peptidoglycan DD-metalloendopeptidase family protein [Xanthomonadales bacterium]